jgi:hypothetical protein
MADNTSVTKAYGSARLAREEAEKILNGTGGRGGLERSWLRVQREYADRNKPGMFTGQIIEEYNRVKKAYQEWSKKYQDAVALETKYKEQVDTATKEENKAKVAKDAADRLAEAKAEKARADSLIPSRGQAQADAAAKVVADAQDAVNKIQGTTVDAQGNTINKPLYNDYTLGVDGNVTNQMGAVSYFIGAPDAKGEIAQTPFTSLAKARDAFLKNYSEPGKIAELQKQLLSSGYIKESDIKDKTWVSGVDDLIRNYTYQSVSDIKYGGAKEPLALDAFLAQKRTSVGTSSKSYKTITTRGDAKKLLDNYMNDLVGRPSTKEEESAFYDQLHVAENKAVLTVGTGVTTGSQLDDADRFMIAAKVARKTLRGTNVDELLKSNIGSTVATDIASIQKYAAAYGIEMTPAEALKRVADGVGQKDYVAKQEERIRQLSMTVHPYLKDHIAAGGTVKDVADVYANAKSYKLGVAVPTSTKDKDIMAALATGKTVTDFERELQSNPLWRQTDEARKMASDFTSTMLKTFGLG